MLVGCVEFRLQYIPIKSRAEMLFSASHLIYLVCTSLSKSRICRAAVEGVICYSDSRQPLPQQQLSASTRWELPMGSSGPLNIWSTQIIAICWRSPPWKARESPELYLQHLKHLKWYLRPVPQGVRAHKYLRCGGRTCSSKYCTIPRSRVTAPEGYGKYSSSKQEQRSSH